MEDQIFIYGRDQQTGEIIPLNYSGSGQNTVFETTGTVDWDNVLNKPVLSNVATSGEYNDLLNKPSLFDGDYNSLSNKPTISTVGASGEYNDLLNKPTLFSGSYTDLTNKPTISTVGASGEYNDLLNKPTLFSGSYTDLTNKPTISTVGASGEYNDLLNKPTLFSGSYTDLTNKPTISTVGASGEYNDLLNKPTLFSGSYTDLTNKPTISTIGSTGEIDDAIDKNEFIEGKTVICNDGNKGLQQAITEVGAQQAINIKLSSGSFGDSTPINCSMINCAISSPTDASIAGRMTEIFAPLTLTSSSQRIRITGIQLKGGLTVNATGSTIVNHIIHNNNIVGLTLTGAKGSGTPFIRFTDCDISNLNIASGWNITTYFYRCQFTGTFTNNNATQGIVVMLDCSGIPDTGAGTINKTLWNSSGTTSKISAHMGYSGLGSIFSDYTNPAVNSNLKWRDEKTELFGGTSKTIALVENLATVASSGAYADLSGKPTLATVATSGSYTDLTNKPSFATVATSGSYNDLINLPTLFSGSYTDLTNKPSFATVATSGAYADLSGKPTLANVAISGDYDDLIHKPTISLVGQTGSYNDLLNKPTLFSGDYNDLTHKPNLANVATSGLYTDLSGTPTLATVATSGSYTDLTNKPSFATVATSGSYNDLINLPTLFSGSYTDLTNKPNFANVATSGAYADLSGTPTLATVATSGSYADLSGKPVLATVATSGSYTDLINTPVVADELDELIDVSITPGTLNTLSYLGYNPTLSLWENKQLSNIASFTSTPNNSVLFYNSSAQQIQATSNIVANSIENTTSNVFFIGKQKTLDFLTSPNKAVVINFTDTLISNQFDRSGLFVSSDFFSIKPTNETLTTSRRLIYDNNSVRIEDNIIDTLTDLDKTQSILGSALRYNSSTFKYERRLPHYFSLAWYGRQNDWASATTRNILQSASFWFSLSSSSTSQQPVSTFTVNTSTGEITNMTSGRHYRVDCHLSMNSVNISTTTQWLMSLVGTSGTLRQTSIGVNADDRMPSLHLIWIGSGTTFIRPQLQLTAGSYATTTNPDCAFSMSIQEM